MRDAGLLQEGDEPSGEDYATYIVRLNDLINLWQTQGLKLWLNFLQPVVLVAGQTTPYYLGPAGATITTKPTRVVEGYYVTASGTSRQLDPLSWNTYNTLSNRIQQGAVTGYFVDKQQDNLAVSLWLVPDTSAATGRVDLLIQKQVTNVVKLTDTMNFPIEWFMALRWGLADDISTGQPPSIVQRCQTRAEAFRLALEEWDVEDGSTFFQPNMR